MAQAVYAAGVKGDRDAIIDFINYVFSHDHRPHDFKTLIPKAYADGVGGIEEWHYLAKRDGAIKGCVAVRPFEMDIAGDRLPFGFVGSVSVHPYDRGAGHMKALVPLAVSESRKKGYAFMVLGGQRQRYGYFGFDTAGLQVNYLFDRPNARHAVKEDAADVSFAPANCEEDIDFAYELYNRQSVKCVRDRESFEAVCRTWDGTLYIIWRGLERIGYYADGGNEIRLVNESDMPVALKALLRDTGKTNVTIPVAPWETERREILYGICENSHFSNVEMLQVLDWKRTLKAFLTLKSGYRKLADGVVTLKVDGETLRICVKDGNVSVEDCDSAELELGHSEAQRLFFSLESLDSDGILPQGWAPLPFWMSGVDGF